MSEAEPRPVRVIVYHSYYGCDTGCCGHTVELLQEGQEQYDGKTQFEWSCWDGEEDPVEFAKRLVTATFGEAHVKDLDWDNCNIQKDY